MTKIVLLFLSLLAFALPVAAQSATPSLPIADASPIPLRRAIVISYSSPGVLDVQEVGKKAARFRIASQPVFLRADNTMFEPNSTILSSETKVLLHFMKTVVT